MRLDILNYMEDGYIEVTKDEKYLVKKDAPEKVKKELKETDEIYFESYGEHIFFFDKKELAQDGIIDKIKAFFK